MEPLALTGKILLIIVGSNPYFLLLHVR